MSDYVDIMETFASLREHLGIPEEKLHKHIAKAALARIKELENPWVSCDERLPEDDQHMKDFVVVLNGRNLIDQWYTETQRWNHYKDRVTAYMPIPENTND